MINYSELKTDRIRLSKLVVEDANDIFAYASDDEVTEFLMWKTHESIEDTASYIQYCINSLADEKVITWGIRNVIDNKLLGTIDLSEYEENIYEIGYVISKKYWGKGYATEATKEIINYVKSNDETKEIVGIAFEGNYGSIKVLEKCGMRFVKIIPDYFSVEGNTVNGLLYSTNG